MRVFIDCLPDHSLATSFIHSLTKFENGGWFKIGVEADNVFRPDNIVVKALNEFVHVIRIVFADSKVQEGDGESSFLLMVRVHIDDE